MATALAVEASVTVNNSPIQDYVHPDDHVQPIYETQKQCLFLFSDPHSPSFPLWHW